jgi:ubiquinone/menaquinone biosynthesis C-methylase UbiE
MENKYLHGYSEIEQERLVKQADILSQYIYPNFDFSEVNHLLELGCGSGGQTQQLLKRNPHLKITGLDISEEQISQAEHNFKSFPKWKENVKWICGSLETIHFEEKVDAVFICWVLEHVANPLELLKQAKKVIKPGGSIYITEVYNHSFDYQPRIPSFDDYFTKYNQLQLDMGGNPHIGPQLGNLLFDAGFEDIKVLPSPNFHDKSTPESRQFMFEYWFDLMKSAKVQLINHKYLTQNEWETFENEYETIYQVESAYFYYCAFQVIAKVY